MRTLVTVLAALLLAGACSSDPTPREPTASATPTAVAPTMPKQAGEDSPEGAAAFVKHWVDVFNYAAATGAVEELSRLSSPDCKGCQNYIQLYRDTYAAGGYFKGGDWTLGELSVESDNDETFATAKVEVAAGLSKKNASAVESSEAGETTTMSFAVDMSDRRPKVSQLGLGEVE